MIIYFIVAPVPSTDSSTGSNTHPVRLGMWVQAPGVNLGNYTWMCGSKGEGHWFFLVSESCGFLLFDFPFTLEQGGI